MAKVAKNNYLSGRENMILFGSVIEIFATENTEDTEKLLSDLGVLCG